MLISELREIFNRHQKNGVVSFEYKTNVYFGQLSDGTFSRTGLGGEAPIAIQPLEESQLAAAKAVVVDVCVECFRRPPTDFEDMDNLAVHYAPPSGCFLVLMDHGRVVGTGAIRRLDEETCELKRMWILPAYRGRGHGRAMAERLLDFARAAGYKCVRLDTAPSLEAANALYRKLGFYPIERYNSGPCSVFMEKIL